MTQRDSFLISIQRLISLHFIIIIIIAWRTSCNMTLHCGICHMIWIDRHTHRKSAYDITLWYIDGQTDITLWYIDGQTHTHKQKHNRHTFKKPSLGRPVARRMSCTCNYSKIYRNTQTDRHKDRHSHKHIQLHSHRQTQTHLHTNTHTQIETKDRHSHTNIHVQTDTNHTSCK